MKISYVIVTYNRIDALRRTLKRLHALVASGEAQDIWVIDNASEDGTAEAVAAAFPDVHLIARASNGGACARTDAVGRATGDLLVFLDDDSYPLPGVVEAAVERFLRQPSLGLLGGAIELPDGSGEASALPVVPVACGMVARHAALQEVGGFDRWMSRQAEEFDLAMRLLQAGWGVERDASLVFRHDKPAGQRASAAICKLDLRNNLVVAGRYLPADLAAAYRRDWVQRYSLIAESLDLEVSMDAAVAEADEKLAAESRLVRQPLSAAAIERVFGLEAQARAVAAWSRRVEPRRVAIADFGKNLFATYEACRRSGLEVVAVTERNPAFVGRFYREVPICAEDDALVMGADGVVLSTLHPATIDDRVKALQGMYAAPILDFGSHEEDAAMGWQTQRGAA
ncbi:glycosyltransferase family 2 protein [Mucisphaera sp.]|uniref:glycosyltransferase family 2 protein n=1 Tax=Mucisphaera sp. TaxID=2913024 RepID=UPI003D09D2D3